MRYLNPNRCNNPSLNRKSCISTGKTGAFSLPIAQIVHETIRKELEPKKSAPISHQDISLKIDVGDKDGIVVLSADCLSCSSTNNNMWGGARATHGVKGSGKYYYEALVTGDGICRFGWSTKAGHLDLGKDRHGFGFGGTGKKSHNNEFLDYGQKFGKGDRLLCMIDLDRGVISFAVNGRDLGAAFDIPSSLRGAALFPTVALKASAATLHFGAASAQVPAGAVSFAPLALAPADHLTSARSADAHRVARGPEAGPRGPRALILEPARDLAEQVYNNVVDVTKYLADPPLTALLLVGGDDSKKQRADTFAGHDILVGTPLKVLDFVKRGALDLSQVRVLVLDEADRLLETGNLDTVMQIYGSCPSGGSGVARLQVSPRHPFMFIWSLRL